MPVTEVAKTTQLGSLNSRFSEQNAKMEEFLNSLHVIASRVSQDLPVENATKGVQSGESLPFNDGELMDYYYKLNLNESLIIRLKSLVEKLDSLV